MPLVVVGGLVFGFGLGLSHMARPEVVLDFLQFEDFGLVFVLGVGSIVAGIAFAIGVNFLDRAPLTGRPYARRLKSFDRSVLTGGVIFGVGWGISGICPGAAYASVGIGNYPILIAIGGMFIGAYAQGLWRARTSDEPAATSTSD
ncbi:YeeE/YedE family protein [Halorussus salinisoli]|uniref:YeeE/YedE family protein n=1 Tax=Halorussus salinisoli TaxID=2558242 RepID=UPI0010C21E96|nr:DUF6691 family protein [Halorussus salinisoli]